MGSLSEEDDSFYDTKEYITPVSDSGSDCLENSDSESRNVEDVIRNFGYEVWIRSPGTIGERRQKLLKLMGIASNQGFDEGDDADSSGRFEEVEEVVDNSRVLEISGTVLRSSFRDLRSSSQSSVSCCSNDTQDLLDVALEENLVRRIRNLDDGSEFIVDELGQDGLVRRLREVGSNRSLSGEEFERLLGLSPLVQRVMRRDIGLAPKNNVERHRRSKRGWLKRLGVVACVAGTQPGIRRVEGNGLLPFSRRRAHYVRVRTHRKRAKEFSGLYMGQDIIGHDGAILTMKFSCDGLLLASAGEDRIVRVWEVTESERSEIVHVHDVDSSHVYFTKNHIGELVPLNIDKEKRGRLKSLRKSTESACVIFPQKVFRLVEKPLHEFHGHRGEVLDLSWSNSKCLLSSSADKTVRLWRVGSDECLKVFSHNDFVTCIQFNPVDENHFISGSVDGKVRIWSVPKCGVVDWTDLREIVTAVCYQPDGKGAIVGSISGDCFFFDTSDNRLQLTNQASLHGKKKAPLRRITGLQFSPDDPSRLMVTTADSKVRILKGLDVICKYKGLRNGGSQISASFTSDGTHIVSASEDSFVYIWDSTNLDKAISSHFRSKSSCERFFSNNACVALPWMGPTTQNLLPSLSGSTPNHPGIMVRYPTESNELQNQTSSTDNSLSYLRTSLFSSDSVSLGLGFSDPFSRGIATWPEEKLTGQNSLTVSSSTCKSEYKFLKTTCQNMAGSTHAWGLVIVTAGWDGRIRVFQNYGLPIRL